MKRIFTHMLDLSNPFMDTDKEIVRQSQNKENWNKVVSYYVGIADALVVNYWEGDLKLDQESQISTKAYDDLLPYRVKNESIGDGMACSFYEINSKVNELLLSHSNPYEITQVFHFELIKGEKVLLSSEDNGTSLLFYADEENLNELIKNDVQKEAIILFPE